MAITSQNNFFCIFDQIDTALMSIKAKVYFFFTRTLVYAQSYAQPSKLYFIWLVRPA